MQASNIPSGIQLPFANAGSKQTIPVASQIGVVNGRASYTDGFPPLTRTAVAAGGVPPFGTDMNGILFAVTAIQQWQTGGGSFQFNNAWSTANNGYPKGAVIANAANDGFWLSLSDNNTTNPDAAANTAWYPIEGAGPTSIALTNANVALTPAQYSKDFIVLTGTLTGNVQLTFPAILKRWQIINGTTGAFGVTAIVTGSAAPVTIGQGVRTDIRSDGTNLNIDTFQTGVAGPVGAVRNLRMALTAVSASATMTADEIVVETALGGYRYCLANFNKTINLATTGAGGMDVGSAPNSGYVALYAIYNPTTGVNALLATNATSAAAPNIYGGANMPSGYTYSALISVWATNSSGQFVVGTQRDRTITRNNVVVLSTSTAVSTPTSLSISAAVPANANGVFGSLGGIPTSGQAAGAVAVTVVVSPDAAQTGAQSLGAVAGGGNGANANVAIPIYTAQTIYYTTAISSGTSSFSFGITGYTF